jgi:tol-pal system protein YbgF
MTRIRSVPAALLVAASLALAACASDDAGVRALNETTTLRAQLDDMRQRQDVSTREITRLQSQVRTLETDAVDKTRDVKAANVELARARVLLEETRGMLREREAAAVSPAATVSMAVTANPAPAAGPAAAPPTVAAARPTVMGPLAPVPPSSPDASLAVAPPPATPAPAPAAIAPPPAASTPPAALGTSPPASKGSAPVTSARPAALPAPAPRPVAPDPRAIPESSAAAKPAPEPRPAPAVKPAPETRSASEPKLAAAPSPAGKPAVRPAPVAAPSAEKIFSAAMANFRAQEHGQAVLELTDLITRYPSHGLAPAAQLWIGEAYYEQRDYQQALIELKRVSEAYPRSPQVADALLKTGLCQRALGDRSAATSAWEQVIREHPESAAAGQARTLLGSRDSAARGSH